ncbi:MAG: DUF4922 domain-containing protein [Ignavibacteriaceae bacterium]|nr:DUF4922 domain-containing protein [Ignavibacteriaceae bacterium]
MSETASPDLAGKPSKALLKEKINYCEAAKNLIRQQKISWEQCKNGYSTLESVEVKVFHFDNFSIKLQFNPGRMISTSAKVDTKSINERKCFLCKENLPQEQQSLEYKDDFLILVNPFPIFPEHFTLPSIHHSKQNIEDSFPVLMDFCKDLSPDYSVFYNGPRCGASAPDHLHFQAGTKNFMTIDHEYELLKEKFGEEILKIKSLCVSAINDGLRKMISFEGNLKSEIEKVFQIFYSTLKKINGQEEEPMMNVLGSYQNEKWRIIVFLRKKHRPDAFFLEDEEKKILLSPAAVDIGGVCITPRQKDFATMTEEKLKDIFNEVFIDKSMFQKYINKLKSHFEKYYHS